MKDMKLQLDKGTITEFFKRYHLVIFVVIVVILLSIAILLLSKVASKASGDGATPTGSSISTFDQETMDKIKKLKTSNDPIEPLDFSKGRVDPFNE